MMPCEEENVVDIGHVIQASMNMRDAHLATMQQVRFQLRQMKLHTQQSIFLN
jgi:hypothetical protein